MKGETLPSLFTLALQYQNVHGAAVGRSYVVLAEHEQQAIKMCREFEEKCGSQVIDIMVQSYERDEKLRHEPLGIVSRTPIAIEE